MVEKKAEKSGSLTEQEVSSFVEIFQDSLHLDSHQPKTPHDGVYTELVRLRGDVEELKTTLGVLCQTIEQLRREA